MPKGRPLVLPRLDDLERAVLELAERVRKLELIRGSRISIDDGYKPLFDKWPGSNFYTTDPTGWRSK